MDNLIPVFALLIGVAAGAVVVWLVLRNRTASALASARIEVAAAQAEVAKLNDELRKETAARAAAEEKNTRIASLEGELENRDSRIRETSEHVAHLQSEATELIKTRAELQTTLDQERSQSKHLLDQLLLQHKQQLEQLEKQHTEIRQLDQARFDEQKEELVRQRKELTVEFENLANKILEDKSKRFTEQNKSNLDLLLKPLGEKIREFEKKVDETYDKESKQRFSREKEIANLRDLNTRIGQDAINLTNALKGQTKTQGNWGEVILERVLEMSGLTKGREYELQVSLTAEDGRRSQPDAVVYLPDDRHIVIDSKVNLNAYERFYSMPEGVERDSELKLHIAAFRKHVDELSIKRYQDHYKLNSLDFVLMFVPIEPAFNLAIGTDNSIYDDAFGRKIIIVTPTTLHATLHTVSNIWKQEHQNRHSQEIARQSAALYDKFVGFVKDLEEIGKRLQFASESYDNAHNKLISGKGNLVKSTENIRRLGIKTKKQLDKQLLDTAFDETEMDADDTENDERPFEIGGEHKKELEEGED